MNNTVTPESLGFVETKSKSAVFLSTVWMYFGLAIAVAAVGAWAGLPVLNAVGSIWVPYGAFMALMFTQTMWGNSKTFGVPMFFLFAFISGVIIAPTLWFAGATGQMDSVFQALIASAGLFFAAAIFGYTTKKNLSGMGQFLMFTMIGLFISSLLNFFVFKSGMGSMIISSISVVLFSAYTAYDLQAIKNGAYSSPIMAATHLYINIFAMFQSLLNLFLSSND